MELSFRRRLRVFALLTLAAPIIAASFGVSALMAPKVTLAAQSIPYKVNFQGRLTDNSGNILADGLYNIKFRFWDAASGGTNKFEEDRVMTGVDNRVQVTNGLFNIQFGDVTVLSPALFSGAFPLYLEVELPTPATATCATNGCAVFTEGAMTPRQPLASSAYAFNADTVDGIDGSSLVQLSPAVQQSGNINISGNLQSGGNLQATGSVQGASATFTAASALTLGMAGPAGNTGAVLFKNATNTNTLTLQSGATGSNFSLTLPTALTAAGDCLKDTTGAGVLGFAACGTAVTLQTAYDNSSSPATVLTSSVAKGVVVQSGIGFNSTTAFQVIPDGTATPTINVDTQNNRVGIGTAAPTEALDVAGAVRLGTTTNTNAGTVRFTGTDFQGYNGTSWVPLNAASIIANQMTQVVKPADQIVNNSATFVDDNDLTFVIGANQTWTYTMVVYGNSSTTADFKFSLTAPSGTACTWGVSETENADSNGNLGCGASSGLISGSGADEPYTVTGVVSSGATAGSVTLQWAQNTAAATNSIVRAGSYLEAMQKGAGSLNPFVQGGNSFGATGVLGTADSHDLSIVANGTEGLHIDISGKVGVGGVSSGGAALDVNGDVALRGIGAPSVAPTGQGRIYFDSGTGHFRVSESGGSFADLLGVTGANAALSNLAGVDLNTSLLTSSSNLIDVGSGTNVLRSGYFGTLVQTPTLSAAANTDLSLQSTGSGNLNLTSGSGTLNLSAATVKTTGQASLTYDLNNVATSTLYVKNTNAGQVANLDITGGLNLGSGQQISFNGTQISSANLSDGSSITKQGNSFNGITQLVQTDGSGALPALSGSNLTNLNASAIATGSGAVNLASGGIGGLSLTSASGTIGLDSAVLQRTANALTIDLATAGTSTLTVGNSNGANVANLAVTGSLGLGTGGAFSVGASSGGSVTCSGGQFLQNQIVTGGIVTGGTCAGTTATDLQTAYDTSSSPATINLNASAKDFVINATDQATDPNVLINLTCATCSAGAGRFAVQQTGTDVLTVNPTGEVVVRPIAGQNLSIKLSSNSQMSISSTSAPSVDQLAIDNTGTTGVTTNDVNGESINYKGGAAAVEASGLRIDFTPGTTSGGTWSGMRIVAGATGPAAGVTEYGLKLEGPTIAGAGTGTGVYVGTGWDIGIDVQSGGLQLAAQANPTTPAAGNLKIYAKAVAGRIVPKWLGPSGVDTPFQAALWGNNTALWTTSGATAGLWQGTVGAGAGTFTAALPTTTNLYTSMIRSRYATVVTTANQQVGQRSSQRQFYRGSVAGQGGFFFFARFGTEAWTAGDRLFVGLGTGTTAMVTGDPSSQTNILGFGVDAGDSAITFMHNTSSGTATKDAIAGQPALAANQGYDVYIYAKPNDSTIYYRMDDLNTGAIIIDSSTTANLPVNTTMMAVFALTSNGANTAATAAQIGVNRMYIETDH